MQFKYFFCSVIVTADLTKLVEYLRRMEQRPKTKKQHSHGFNKWAKISCCNTLNPYPVINVKIYCCG